MADATAIAKAYVQILPTTKNLGKALKGEMDKAGEEAGDSSGKKAGGSFGSAFSGALKAAGIAVAAIGAVAAKVATDVINATAELQQNLGGSEAVFGEYAQQLQSMASEAYKNMGTSASDYLATANKIGALLQGSGMDQARSMDLATQAMQRAADMASVMGISTEEALEAITGAAKGNFTMMDNIGVKMTATSLAAYAAANGYEKLYSEMTEAEKVEVAMKAFFDNTTQYAGNFEREATQTISGAFGMLGASWQDFITGLGTEGADIGALTQNVVSSLLAVVDNVQPVLQNIVAALPQAVQGLISAIQPLIPDLLEAGKSIFMSILDGIVQNLPSIISTAGEIILELVNAIVENLPLIIESGIQAILALVAGISAALPDLIPSVVEAILTICETLIDNLDMIIDAAITLIMALAEGLIQALPILIEKAPIIIIKLVDGLIRNLPKIVQAAFELIGKLAGAIVEALPQIGSAAGQVIGEFVRSIKDLLTRVWAIGKEIVSGVWNGIKEKATWFYNQVKGFFSNMITSVKNVLGIKSPSKEFAEVGRFITEGLAVGIGDDGAVRHVRNEVSDVLGEISGTTFDGVTAAVSADVNMDGGSIYSQLASAINNVSSRLDHLQIFLDSGALVGAISEKMDGKLGAMSNLTARGATV